MRPLLRPLSLRVVPLILLDLGVVFASYAGALLLRFDGEVPAKSWDTFWQVAPVVALGYVLANLLFGVYHTEWKYGGVRDLFNLATAVVLVTLIATLVNSFDAAFPRRHLPLSVNLIGGGLAFLLMSAIKVWPHLTSLQLNRMSRNGSAKRILIVGAGDAGQLVAREFLQNPHWECQPVCFVDDDLRKSGVRIHGIPVAGDRHAIPALVKRNHIDEVALTMSQISRESFNELLDLCKKAGVSVNIIPSPADVLSGKVDRGITVSFTNQGRRAG